MSPLGNALGLIEAAAKNAAARSVRAQIGKISFTPRFLQWENQVPTEITQAQYEKLDPKMQGLELVIAVDIKEFSPTLEWTYERRVGIGGPDWNKIFMPSIETVLGKGTMSDGTYASTLSGLDGQYVEIHDVPQIKKPEYNTAKLTRVFTSREEAKKAHDEIFGAAGAQGASSVAASGDVPPDWDAKTWSDMIPAIKASPKTHAEVAAEYGVPVPFIVKARA